MRLSEIKNSMPSKIIIPKEFDLFFEWTQNKDNLIGGNIISGAFEWYFGNEWADGETLESWFGKNNYSDYKISERLGVFGIGCSIDNMYCFWIDDTGNQKIVHLDFDAYDLLVLGNNFIEFLQYLAIGYDYPDANNLSKTLKELEQENTVDYNSVSRKSKINDYKKQLENLDEITNFFDGKMMSNVKKYFENEISRLQKMDDTQFKDTFKDASKGQEISGINYKLRTWIKDTFRVKIPKKGTEIINPEDKSFKNWVIKALDE